MKKLISLLLALTMVFSLAICASAVSKDEDGNFVTETQITLDKKYTEVNEGMNSPAEKLTFTYNKVGVKEGGMITNEAGELVAVDIDSMPDLIWTDVDDETDGLQLLDLAEGNAEVGGKLNTITIGLPTYDAVGIYAYKIKEVSGELAGVDYYDEKDMYIVVTVIQNDDDKIQIAAVHAQSNVTLDDDGFPVVGQAKESVFENTYSAGDLTITKTVEGDFGDKARYFDVTVTFTSDKVVGADITYAVGQGGSKNYTGVAVAKGWSDTKTVTIQVKHGDTITFENIPYDVTYAVSEANGDHTDTYKNDGEAYTEDTAVEVSAAAHQVDITNTKTGSIDTGITLDSMPFVLILAVCAGAAVLFVTKRRSVEF